MNCNEARDLLSEYIDQTISNAEREAVEAHITTCSDCREGKEALAELVADVASLDTVEPPLGFSQRVMSKIKEKEIKPGFWERVFLPLKSKIPIQVVGLLLVAGLATYLYRINPFIQEAFIRMTPLDSNRSGPATPFPSEDSDLKEQRDEREGQEVVSTQGSAATGKKQETSSEGLDKAGTEMRTLSQGKTGSRKKTRSEGKSIQIPSSIQAPSPLSFQEGDKSDSIAGMTEPPDNLQQQSVSADLEWFIVLDPSVNRNETRKTLETLLQTLGGSFVEQKNSLGQFRKRDDKLAETHWIRLPDSRLNQFKNQLASLGKITLKDKRSSIDISKSLQVEKSLDEVPTTLKSKVSKNQALPLLIKLIIQP